MITIDTERFIKAQDNCDSYNVAFPKHLRPKVYRQTRTMVDMLIAMNEEAHFTSAQEALESLLHKLDRLAKGGNEITFNCSWRGINAFAGECFENGELDVDKLQEACTHHFDDTLTDVYAQYVAEKTAVIVSYMNEFRRYTDPQDVLNDFEKATGCVYHCGPNPHDYSFPFWGYIRDLFSYYLSRLRDETSAYFPFYDYIRRSFSRYLSDFWDEMSTNGVLDNGKLRDFMIERHGRGVKKYGLENVLKRYFKGHPCFPSVLEAYRGGAAPIYAIDEVHRRYIKSWGISNSPLEFPDFFEFNLIESLLREDPKYTIVNHSDYFYEYYVPKEDYTLPVYKCKHGRMYFESEKDKLAFIKKLCGHA